MIPIQNSGETFTYKVVLEDGTLSELEAIGDSQAIGICQRLYPKQKFELYRIAQAQEIPVCLTSPNCPQIPPPAEHPQPPAFS